MNDLKRKKELRKDLSDWLGRSFKKLPAEEQEQILNVYGDLTKSRLRDPLETIRVIGDKEFNYGILIVGSIYGVSLSLFASAIVNYLDEILTSKDLLSIMAIGFIVTTALLIFALKGISRGDAEHWKLLESLQEEVRKSSTANPNENRDVVSQPDHSPESTSSSGQSL